MRSWDRSMLVASRNRLLLIMPLMLLAVSSVSCMRPLAVRMHSDVLRVELASIHVDSKDPQRKQFGDLVLVSAFRLRSNDKRFGGLSGLSLGVDGRLYAVSDRGYWIAAKIVQDSDGKLLNLVDWQISPILTATNAPVSGMLRDAEALTIARDGSFVVGFEGVHRIWRYAPAPNTFKSTPVPVETPAALSRAPGNGGIEGITTLPDGRLLFLTEQLENPDGSFRGWILGDDRSEEFSYLPDKNFHVTDCAALANGDLLVLERSYRLFGILSARVTLVRAEAIRAGAKLVGIELLRLAQPLAAENFEGLAARHTSRGTMIFMVSDDNFNPFQQTLLLQFVLPKTLTTPPEP